VTGSTVSPSPSSAEACPRNYPTPQVEHGPLRLAGRLVLAPAHVDGLVVTQSLEHLAGPFDDRVGNARERRNVNVLGSLDVSARLVSAWAGSQMGSRRCPADDRGRIRADMQIFPGKLFVVSARRLRYDHRGLG
jgi:hypothetical protein